MRSGIVRCAGGWWRWQGGGRVCGSESPLGPVDASFRALSGRLKFTVRHKFNKDYLSVQKCLIWRLGGLWAAEREGGGAD